MPSDFNENVIEVSDPDERDAIYTRQKEIAPPFAEYEKNAAPRLIPVVVLDPVA